MKYHIITFGCQMNKSDSERVASFLEKKGYKAALKIEKADLIVVNMCSVRQSAVDRVYGLSPKFKKLKKNNPSLKTLLTGCIVKKDKKKLQKDFDFILNIKSLPEWQKVILSKKKLSLSDYKNNGSYLKIKPKCQNKFLAYVPISNGCNNFCSYCVVPYTRGRLTCRNHKEILQEIKNLAKKGVKEIWLLGQNVNDYKSGKKINFAKLLKMINNTPGNFSVRFISPHPADFSDELIKTMAECKKIAKFINLPVQSGDDTILKKMNRPYTAKQYKNLVKKIRKNMPDINLSTDVIIGFPGETKKQFQNTAKLLKEIKFNIAYISKYSPRPGTAAFKMKDNVPLKEKKGREKILINIINNG